MNFGNLFKKKNNSALKLICDNYSAIGDYRKSIIEKTINLASQRKDRFDPLALAIAYEWKGAKFRKESILFYEEFLSLNIPLSSIEFEHHISEWQVFSSLSTLYEKEYEFEKAIQCLKQCQKCSKNTNPADFTRIADILVKIDVNKALDYCEQLKTSRYYSKHKYAFDCTYNHIVELKNKGYQYKARKNKG